jgi:hypothetical protein
LKGVVLKNEHGQRDRARRRIRLTPARQQAEHDGCAAEGDEKPGVETRPEVDSSPEPDSRHERHGPASLKPAPQSNGPLQPGELRQAELDADLEEQQNYADLREGAHELGVPHEAQRLGPHRHARQQKPGDRDESNPGAEISDERAQGKRTTTSPRNGRLAARTIMGNHGNADWKC